MYNLNCSVSAIEHIDYIGMYECKPMKIIILLLTISCTKVVLFAADWGIIIVDCSYISASNVASMISSVSSTRRLFGEKSWSNLYKEWPKARRWAE